MSCGRRDQAPGSRMVAPSNFLTRPLEKKFNNSRDTIRHGAQDLRGGNGIFLRAQGEVGTPGRYRIQCSVGQPLASESRSIAIWDLFLGLMRFRPLGAQGGTCHPAEGAWHRRLASRCTRLPGGHDTRGAEPGPGARTSAGGAHGSRVTDKESSIRPASLGASPYPGLARDQSPPKRPILRDRRQADLIVVGEQAVLGSVVSPATVDALAAPEAGTEVRGDSELAIVRPTPAWPPQRRGPSEAPWHVRRPTCASCAACGPYRGKIDAERYPKRYPQRKTAWPN